MIMRFKGILCTALSALLFGFTPVLASFTYDMGSNAETLTFYHNVMAIPMTSRAYIPGEKKGFSRVHTAERQAFPPLIIGVIGCGVTTLTLYKSYDYVGIGVATTLHFLYPVLVALLCRVFL